MRSIFSLNSLPGSMIFLGSTVALGFIARYCLDAEENFERVRVEERFKDEVILGQGRFGIRVQPVDEFCGESGEFKIWRTDFDWRVPISHRLDVDGSIWLQDGDILLAQQENGRLVQAQPAECRKRGE